MLSDGEQGREMRTLIQVIRLYLGNVLYKSARDREQGQEMRILIQVISLYLGTVLCINAK